MIFGLLGDSLCQHDHGDQASFDGYVVLMECMKIALSGWRRVCGWQVNFCT